jgi:hypothetical protein
MEGGRDAKARARIHDNCGYPRLRPLSHHVQMRALDRESKFKAIPQTVVAQR